MKLQQAQSNIKKSLDTIQVEFDAHKNLAEKRSKATSDLRTLATKDSKIAEWKIYAE